MFNIRKIRVFILLAASCLFFISDAHANGGGRGRGGHDRNWVWGRNDSGRHDFRHFPQHGLVVRTIPRNFISLSIGGSPYYYCDGVYYRRSYNNYIVVPAPIGTVVNTIPSGYPPVVVDGVPYYNINGVTYMATSNGYKVVPQPSKVVTTIYNNVPGTPPPAGPDSFVVNVPNTKGGYTAVNIKRYGTGYTGPQNEYYEEFPSVDQLKAMYAK